jgi:hypothetical protein
VAAEECNKIVALMHNLTFGACKSSVSDSHFRSEFNVMMHFGSRELTVWAASKPSVG